MIFAAALAVLAVLNLAVFPLPDEPAPKGEFADVGNGARIHYVEHAGKGKPIVLLHGAPGVLSDFDRVVSKLNGRHWIAIDRPGYGASEGRTGEIYGQADSIHTLLKKLRLEDATVVGHSYGGALALALADRHPEDVGRILLVAAAAGGIKSGLDDKASARLIQFTHLPVIEQGLDVFAINLLLRGVASPQVSTAFSPDPVDPAYKRQLLAYSLKDSDLDALQHEVLDSADDRERLDRQMRSIRQKTLVLQGRSDSRVNPRFGAAIANRLPNAKLIELEGGHMTPWVRPQEIVRAITRVER